AAGERPRGTRTTGRPGGTDRRPRRRPLRAPRRPGEDQGADPDGGEDGRPDEGSHRRREPDPGRQPSAAGGGARVDPASNRPGEHDEEPRRRSRRASGAPGAYQAADPRGGEYARTPAGAPLRSGADPAEASGAGRGRPSARVGPRVPDPRPDRDR